MPTQPGTQPVHYGKPALPWANFSSSPLSGSPNMTSGTNVAFPAASAAAANSHFGFGFAGHPNPMSVGVATTLTTSQSLDLSPKTWGTSTGMNPFMVSINNMRNPFCLPVDWHFTDLADVLWPILCGSFFFFLLYRMRPVLPRDGLTILFYSHTLSV